jgi:hypothetical protein
MASIFNVCMLNQANELLERRGQEANSTQTPEILFTPFFELLFLFLSNIALDSPRSSLEYQQPRNMHLRIPQCISNLWTINADNPQPSLNLAVAHLIIAVIVILVFGRHPPSGAVF